MNLEPLLLLATDDLRQLADALRSGRIGSTPEGSSLERVGIRDGADRVAMTLRTLEEGRASHGAALLVIETLICERDHAARAAELCELVWTGPDVTSVPSRDTSVVMRGLFAASSRSVLVAGYAVYQGREVFAELARRMDELVELEVRLFLDVQRPRGDTTRGTDLVARFAERFRTREWPGRRLPKVFYDPRSLELEPSRRASLHAKCVVVDGVTALVTSANFTMAAMEKNVELGLLVRSPRLARQIEMTFDGLTVDGRMRSLPL